MRTLQGSQSAHGEVSFMMSSNILKVLNCLNLPRSPTASVAKQSKSHLLESLSTAPRSPAPAHFQSQVIPRRCNLTGVTIGCTRVPVMAMVMTTSGYCFDPHACA